MKYKVLQTLEAENDVYAIAEYILYELKNREASVKFLREFKKEIKQLASFPRAYKCACILHQEYMIRLKIMDTYYIFFLIKEVEKEVIILRVLKQRQNWKAILRDQKRYHFK